MSSTDPEGGTLPRAAGGRLRRRCALALTAAIALGAFAAPPALADDAGVPDPLANGPRTVKKVEYEAGTLLLDLPTTVGGTTSVPMRGSIHYPTGPGLSKIIVFIHGRHGVCIGSPPPGEYFCGDDYEPDGTPVRTDIRSYGGYDYMADNLASHGYLVMSIEANITNFDNGYSDAGANARSQIIRASLSLLFRWNNGAGPIVVGQDDHTIGTKLVGKANFAEGIGMMGHSRGGDAVTDYITYNKTLPNSQRYTLDGVVALAPTNYTANKTPTGTNYAMLLPACDGDVSTLQGGRLFENAKYGAGGDNFAKVQWYVEGTNHNFYNTTWTGDDYSNSTDLACSRQQPTSKRLTPADQRRVGQGLMNSFLRRYVGNEKAFDPMMTGEVTLPSTAAPLESGVDPSEEVKTSYIGPVSQRLDVLRPTPSVDPLPDPLPDVDPDALTKTAQGGPLTTEGLSLFNVCRPAAANGRGLPSLVSNYPTCLSDNRNRAVGTQYTVTWEQPSKLTAALGPDGETKDVSPFGVLDLRMAVIRQNPLNPETDGFTPSSASQNFDVTLVDADGNRATTEAALWGKAVQSSINTRIPHTSLNGLRIPLTAFAGVDLTKIAAVEFGFGTKTATGAIQLADVMFQEAPKPVTPVEEEPETPPTDSTGGGTPAPVPTPAPVIINIPVPYPVVTAVSATSPSCKDDVWKPKTTLTRVSLSRKLISVKGEASDKGCAEAKGSDGGGVKRTVVEIWRPAGKGLCKFVGSSGKLRKASDCEIPYGLYASKTTSWSLTKKKAKLPKGTYRVRVKTFDKAGNTTILKTKKVKVS